VPPVRAAGRKTAETSDVMRSPDVTPRSPRRARRLASLSAIAIAAAAAATAGLSAGRGAAPSPASVLGFEPCADRTLATSEQIADYFRALDAASDRVQVFDIGRTVGGRTQLLAAISSEENLRSLDRYKDTSRRLARATGLDDDQARALAREGRAVVWIDFGLHSSELAHAQTAPLLAWKVATEETPEMRAVRDGVILVLVPDMNPDGTTLWARWYRAHAGTPLEPSSPPELYHAYAGHDNNRDWFMFNLPESRNIARQLYEEWLPQIVYNQHQEAPFPARIFIPPFSDPMNPHIPPLVIRGIAAVGEAMGRRFEQEGKRGAVSRVGFDTWWNGGMRTAPSFHNMIGILTETAHASPAPATYDPARFPRTFENGVSTTEPSTSYPSPYRGGRWRFRDSCDYMVTASMAVLDIGAKRREEWLYDIYQMGRDAIRAGAGETYVIPAEQWDRGAADRLVGVLQLGGIDVDRATGGFSAGGRRYAPGSYVIRAAQAFRPYLADLLSPQVYPDRRRSPGGPPVRPYDVTGWTLPYQMGVRVDLHAREPVDVATERVSGPPARAPVSLSRAGFGYAIDPRSNDAFLVVNRLLDGGARIFRTTAPIAVHAATWPAGTFIVPADGTTRDRLAGAAGATAATLATLDAPPAGDARRLERPRVGLYGAWGGNMDEGWTRWLLEQFEFPFTILRDADLRAGQLAERMDVIVLPDATYRDMLNGLAPGTMPPEYVGGMTPAGVSNLYAFVTAGGTLVALDTAAELPLTAFGLPIREVGGSQRDADVYVPGSLLRFTIDASHPVGYGMPDEAAAFVAASPLFEIGRRRTRAEERLGETPPMPEGVQVVARYAQRDLLMSGWLVGESLLSGHPSVIDARLGRGRVVLVGFRAQHRAQPHGTFKILFNALYLGRLAEHSTPLASTP
jgi:hypothetical protein